MIYEASFIVPMELIVTVAADNEDVASEEAWNAANEYLETVMGDNRVVRASASLDGIGAATVTAVRS